VLVVVALAIAFLPACRHLPRWPGGRGGGCAPIGGVPADWRATPRAPTGPATPTDTVAVDLTHPVGPVNRDLTGVVWNAGDRIAPVGPLHPAEVRVDASLQDRSLGPDQLDLRPLLDRVAQIRAIGAEPLVLMSYMPRWLGAPRAAAAGGKDPTRMGPYDLDVWQDLVTTVVRTLATAPQPAYRFEVWNEPDLQGIFWADTYDEFTAMALRTHEAVAEVERETGLPLEVGGPAAAFGLNETMLGYLAQVAASGLPLDFVTWHKYANAPFLGPDGPEGNLPEELYRALAKRNPNTTPLQYSQEIAEIKAKVAGAIAGHGLSPRFVIDEWNVSAGGYDVRNDDGEGASLVAGILVEMERADLDGADLYRAISGSDDHVGDWGLTYSDGAPKPSWWVFRAWWAMTGSRLATTDDPAVGLWARATRDRGCVSVLLSNFVATGAPARTVQADLDGPIRRCPGGPTATLSRLDPASSSLAPAEPLRVERRHHVTVPMAPQSVALVRVSC